MSRANLQRFPCVFFIQKRPLAQTILAQAAIKTVALLRIKIAREEQGESRARSQVKRPSDAAKLTCPHWAIKSGFQRLSAVFSGLQRPSAGSENHAVSAPRLLMNIRVAGRVA